MQTSSIEVLVASGQKNMMRERMKLLNMLWENDVNAEMLYKANPKLLTQFQYAETERIPLVAIIGESELEEGKVKLRHTVSKEERLVDRNCFVAEARSLLLGYQE